MSKKNENNASAKLSTGLVPKLRFSEFENDEGWQKKNLKNVLIEYRLGGNYDNSESEDGIPVIKMGNIGRGDMSIDKVFRLVNGIEYCDEDILKYGDVLFNTRNTLELVGKVAIWRSELPFALYNSNLMRFTFDLKQVGSSFFMNYLFNHQVTLKKIRNIATGTTSVAAVYTKDLMNLDILLPSISEQQKIASCLSSLDEVITAESQKLEVLKDHKKGLLQNLFPQEGDASTGSAVPKFRFKEFEGSGEWGVKKLGEVAEFINDKTTLETLSINSYISTENILPDFAGVTLSSKLPTLGNFTKYERGDVLISNIRPYLKKVWFSSNDGAASNDVIVVRSRPIVLKTFLSFLLKNDSFINYVMEGAEGVKMPRGNKDSIKSYPMFFPTDLKEQQKIASCLSSLDDLIIAQNQKIEALQLHKKGLLQGLFPNVNPSNSMDLESGRN